MRAAAGCKNFYRTHGFVYLPSLIPEDEVASLHTRLDELVAAELRSVFAAPLLRDGAAGKGSRQGEGRRAEQVGAQPDDAAAAGLVS